ncbi:multicomponent Na+:H+ antiporter subunit B [Devosia enhydra]|uniref:Multicomponent Na+:H+ antiporter subunit B n=1 Tax=Devosia enhydra TaxID=665118 RepID=A0A1K2I128_9HYPH|nr:MnhB domain-containing protein [Devosia enhydra]SFZ85907.1 multicomponent Na+:H+ antiporter subunit B [Devosia enhydra]
MNTLIFRTIGPFLVAIMLVFSVFVTLRGHNEPGGGFIGGLIAASAIAIYGMSSGVATVRRALRVNPIAIAGAGAALSGIAGFASLAFEAPFMTGLWAIAEIGGYEINVSSPMVFDIGVYLVVLGTISAVALALEDDGGED